MTDGGVISRLVSGDKVTGLPVGLKVKLKLFLLL